MCTNLKAQTLEIVFAVKGEVLLLDYIYYLCIIIQPAIGCLPKPRYPLITTEEPRSTQLFDAQ
jgi:hypothetical protein